MLRPNFEQRIKLSHKLAVIGACVLLQSSPWSLSVLETGVDAQGVASVLPSQNLGSGVISGQQDDVSSASDTPARRGFNFSRMIFKLY